MVLAARGWLSNYDKPWLRRDITAGITLAAYLLPAAIGDASLAGLPPQAGLYACLFGGLVFWLFCSSRQTAVSVTSAISLLVGATLADIAVGDPVRHAALAATTALLVAVLAFAAYAIRAGAIVNFFSETVLAGFKCGVALFLASTQLPKLFGFAGSHGDFWERIGHFFRGLGETNPTSLVLGIVALGLLLLGKTTLKNRPVALFVLILGIVAAGAFRLDERGVALLGEVPQGLPVPTLPAVSRADLNTILPLAMACFVLAAVETTAIGRMFAAKHGYRLDATQEFLAIGGANLAAGLGSGFPVSGGMSQSLVNETAGARTPLSGLVAGLITLIVTLFFTGLLRNLPQPVLAAIVLVAVTGLIRIDALRTLWRFSRMEFAIAMVALLGVLGSGLLNGVLLGAGLSIILLLGRASRPRVIELGRVPGTSYFADLIRHPENERAPDIMVARSEGSLLYFNVDYVRDQLLALVRERATPPRLVIFFLGGVPFVDLAGTELLLELKEKFGQLGIEFRLAEVHGPVRQALRRLGDGHASGLAEAHQTVDDVLTRWRASTLASTAS
ncbi:MAG TPA: SulP family inorganic anion transporter [Vicinamibacterales bacterium]|nr:SulP family inorganic anion transporter [Vicinamibacterales bacterium]